MSRTFKTEQEIRDKIRGMLKRDAWYGTMELLDSAFRIVRRPEVRDRANWELELVQPFPDHIGQGHVAAIQDAVRWVQERFSLAADQS